MFEADGEIALLLRERVSEMVGDSRLRLTERLPCC